MKKKIASSEVVVDGLYQSVRKIIEQGRKAVSIAANVVLVWQNWAIGKLRMKSGIAFREQSRPSSLRPRAVDAAPKAESPPRREPPHSHL